MGQPTVTVRCPSCGQELRVALAPSPPTQWFPCPRCHAPVPVVAPRDLPPLYTWEVIPGLYPQLAFPRKPRWRAAPIASVALAVASVLALVAAGLLGYDGVVASQPATYAVTGTVYRASGNLLLPVAGASVALSVNGALFATRTTGLSGAFAFTGVPDGGLELNVTASGYGPTVVYTFASRSYSTQTLGLDVLLEPGEPQNSSVDSLTPFGDLETLLAYVGGAAVLLAVAGGVAAAASFAVRRPNGSVTAVVGAGAAVAVPVVLLVLALGDAFPPVAIVAGVVGGIGAFALVLATAGLASRPSQVEPI